ncbi:S26 family signal peptidase [Alishewanella tabrizica]
MRDYRNQSVDSRYFTSIHKDQIVGRSQYVLVKYKLNNKRFI